MSVATVASTAVVAVSSNESVSDADPVFDVVKLGISALIVYSVTRPLLSFILKKAEVQASYVEKAISNTEKAIELLTKKLEAAALRHAEDIRSHNKVIETQTTMQTAIDDMNSSVVELKALVEQLRARKH